MTDLGKSDDGTFPRPINFPIPIADVITRVDLPVHSVIGDPQTMVESAAALDEGQPGTIVFCNRRGERARKMIDGSRASLVVCYPDVGHDDGKCYIYVDDPKHWFCAFLNDQFPEDTHQDPAPEGTSDGQCGRFPGVTFGRGCVINPDVQIGPGSIIGNNVSIYRRSRIGRYCVIADGCVIGGNGISFTKTPQKTWMAFPHLGRVVIGDNVRLGQNTVVQRGLLKDTQLNDEVKIGALVNVAHNSIIGKRTWISAGITFCGSVRTGEDVFIGAGAILSNHLRIGSNAKVAAGSFVVKNISPGTCVLGSPARQVPFLSEF